MSDEQTTVGVYFNAREQREVLEPFDETFPDEKRSTKIKDAMRMYQYVCEVMDEQELTFPAEQDRRIWVRQAVLNELRRSGEAIEQRR